MLRTLSQNLTLQEKFESAAQIKEELKLMEFDSLRFNSRRVVGLNPIWDLDFFRVLLTFIIMLLLFHL